MKNRFLSLLLAAILVISLVPVQSFAAEVVASGSCGDNITWTLDTNGILTFRGSGDMVDNSGWPEWLNYSGGFYGQGTITQIVVENGITSICESAFNGCTYAEEISLPNSLVSIGEYAFNNCESITSLAIPDSVEDIGMSAFKGCSSLISINIPSKVTSIDVFAFEGCNRLESITVSPNSSTYSSVDGVLFDKAATSLVCYPAGKSGTSYNVPNSVQRIEQCAFYDCTKLNTVNLPAKTSSVSIQAFSGCLNLKAINVDAGNTNYSSKDGVLLNKAQTNLVAYPAGKTDMSYVIPADVTAITRCAFQFCTRLQTITFPAGLTLIEYRTFEGCTGLTNVVFPEGLTTIGNYSFSGCSNVTSVTIPSTVRTISKGAFSRCNALSDIYYAGSESDWTGISIDNQNDPISRATVHYNSPQGGAGGDSNVTASGFFGQEGDNLIWTLSKDGTLSIGGAGAMNSFASNGSPWYEYREQIKTVEVGNGITNIGGSAFSSCGSLGRAVLPSSIDSIGEGAFNKCSNLYSVEIPYGVTEIQTAAFNGCNSLTRITLPGSLQKIHYMAFSGCKALRNMIFPSGLTVIGMEAFYGCTSLEGVYIPTTVTDIISSAFDRCTALQHVYYQGNSAQWNGMAIESGNDPLLSAERHYNSSAYGGNSYKVTGTCGDNLTWEYIDVSHTLTISGNGAMDDFDFLYDANGMTNKAPWADCSSIIFSVEIKNGVTSIGDGAFTNCPITSVTIPSSVTSIGDGAFCNCNLASVTIPYGIESIGERAFSSGLEGTLTISDSVKSIGAYAFCDCRSLTSVVIGNHVESIGDCAFEDCYNISTLTLGSSLKSIGRKAFYGCGNLTSVMVPNGVISIADAAFGYCSNLEKLIIPGSVTEISGIGRGCDKLKTAGPIGSGCNIEYGWTQAIPDHGLAIESLTKITVPDGITCIGAEAFAGTNINEIILPNSVINLGYSAFRSCAQLNCATLGLNLNFDSSENRGAFTGSAVKTLVFTTDGTEEDTTLQAGYVTSLFNNSYYSGENGTIEIILSHGIKKLEGNAFYGCNNLVSVKIPSSVTSVEDLLDCFGDHAFSNCRSLTNIQVDENNPVFSSLDGVLFNKDKSKIVCYPEGKEGTYTIPNSVTSIAGAFYNCDGLTSVEIPSSVSSIGDYAFYSCDGLTSVSIPGGVASIGDFVFRRCNSLTDVYYKGTEAQWNAISIGSNNECLTSATIHFKEGTADPATGKVKVSNIKISAPEGTTVRVGESIQLLAMVYPSNATNKSVEWLYTDPSTNIISVDKTGKVTGLKAGKTMVGVVSADTNKLLDTIEITVEGVGAYAGYKYSFRNHITSFSSSGNYRIPPERYLQAGFSRAKADSLLVDWGGSCYGMSLSSILFYKDVLKEEHYDRNVHYPSQFDKPKTNDAEDKKLREMIELFQVSQFLPEASEYYFSAPEIAAEIARGNPVELHLIAEGASENTENDDTDDTEHAVVIYDCVFDSTYYYFDIYDCSGYVNSLICNVNGDWKIDYRDSKYDFYPYAYMTVGQMKTVYQSIKSGNVNNAVSLFSADSNYSYLFTPGTNLTLENSSGNKSTIEDGCLTGNIDDIRLMRKGSFTDNPTYTITVPTDDYTITGVNTLSMANDELSVAVEATGPITVSADLKTITAGAGNYTVTYTTYGNDYDTMTLTGNASNTVTCVLGDKQATVTGANSLTASATVSEETVNMTVTEASGGKLATFGAVIPARAKTPAPVYDLESGTYEAGQTLTFTKDDDTVVYYSINGGDEAIYSLPISVDRSMTVTAHAEKYGYDNSDTVTLTYNLPKVEAPAPSVEEGTYQTAQYVDLFNGDYEADVYYTTNGEDPREDGLLFGSSLVLTEDTTVKAYAVKDGCASEVVTLQYDITLSDDFMLINAPSDQNGEVITADTLNDLTAVRLVVQKFSQGAKTGRFAVAFYDENGRYLGMGSRQAEIAEDTATVMVPITENIVGAAQMKVFLMDDSYCPAGSALKFVLN